MTVNRNVIKEFERTSTSVDTLKFDLAPLTNGREGAVSDFLPSGVTISSFTVSTSSDDLTIDSSAKADSDTSVNVTVSGGSATHGAASYLDLHVVRSDADEDDFSIRIVQVQRISA